MDTQHLRDITTSGLSSSTMTLVSRSQTLMEGPVAAHSQYLRDGSDTNPDSEAAEPVGAEGEGVDGVGVLEGVEVLAVVEVPEHGLAVPAPGGAEGAVRAHGDGVQVARVADVVGLQLAVGQVPHLHVLVPAGGDDDGVLVVWREPGDQKVKEFKELKDERLT